MTRHGWTHGAAIVKAYRAGVATEGCITGVQLDTSQSVNKRHPWQLSYTFEVDGHLYEGNLTSFDTSIAQRSKGQPLWVLYIAGDPSQSTIYPAVK